MKAKVGLFFFLLGLILSAICGAIVGNRTFYILTISLISGLVLSIISLMLYKILEIKVPEFIQLLENFKYSSYSDEGYGEYEEEPEASETIDEYTAKQSSVEQEKPIPHPSEPKKKEKSSPDVLTIDNITIKNEPKLMAEAIRTMLASDEPTSNSSATSASSPRK
ncbi:MAG: hypothetical protein N3A69_04820 [Leptospiraceae bacterium]|nr:hypothetical protein [Leptospiraceae bacterium]